MKRFEEGDLVHIKSLNKDSKECLSDALESAFEEIKFYFIEQESDHMIVLSAETNTKFAIVQCSVNVISDTNVPHSEEVEAIIHQSIIDTALKLRNEEMFYAQIKYKKQMEILTVHSEEDLCL